jgi:large subunit ribosomal protein L13
LVTGRRRGSCDADIFTMRTTPMKTYSPKPDHIERRWYVVDASGQVLGRLASEVATLLRGKHKPMFAPHMDTGDHVIVVNADQVELTGNKAETKIAYRHSGYPGGIKGVRYAEYLVDRPVQAVEKAVRGMLPKNRLGRQMIKKLHVVPGPEHPHAAQKPVALAVGERPAWTGLPVPEAKPARKPAARSKEAVPEEIEEAVAAPAGQTTDAGTTTAETTTAKKTTAKKTTAKKTTAKKTKPAAEAAETEE